MSTEKDVKDGVELIQMPVLPLRDVVVYPHMVIPLFVGREKSIKALESAMMADKQVLLVAQKNPNEDQPVEKDIFTIGTVATVLQLLKLPDGTVKVLVEGLYRGKLSSFQEAEEFFLANVECLYEDEETDAITAPAEGETAEYERDVEVLMRSVLAQFEKYVNLNKKIPPEILTTLANIPDATRLADTISAHLAVKLTDKQELLEIDDVKERLEKVLVVISSEIDLLQVEKRIRGRVERQMKKSQREYYLNEQMKAIQNELGDLDNAPNEIEMLTKKIKEAGMPKEAREKCESELSKMKMMAPMSAESTVSRNYLDWVLGLPWKERSRLRNSLKQAETILEDEHYGLKEVKERILEYLAVQKRVKKLKGPILCLVGPPGVGKTSLGQSIAHATGRKYIRMSLGGVRDEAEIRGHRRTYIGALPGKIIQKISKVHVKNPFFLLDEIDKMASDFRGDPASALLEVLDPEQNITFNDHYLEVDYDLSDVMFVATANTLNIPAPLLDRMEVIRLSGYTEDEKINIAIRHLVAKQVAASGLKPEEIQLDEDLMRHIIRFYTREAGVRSLEREIAKVCRKVVKELLLDKKLKTIAVTPENVENYLGVIKYRYGEADEFDQVGQVTGLAWTEVGGELLRIEATVMPGKGKAICTGQLGSVMQESITAAMTVVKSRAELYGISPDFFEKHDVHIHVPEGATPKDGPSAGVGMCTAIVSVLQEIPVHAEVAMTGEITLRGEVLPIGGLKEKLLAAHRGGVKTVIIPEENEKDLKEIPDNIKADLEIHPVRWIDQVLSLALTEPPERKSRIAKKGVDKAPIQPRSARKDKDQGENRDKAQH